MSAPLGPENINSGAWPFMASAHGHGDTSIANLAGQDQDTVIERFKEQFIGQPGSGVSVFTSTTGPLAEVFGGLPNIAGASLPLRIISAIAGRLLGVNPAALISGASNGDRVGGVLVALQKVPILGELVQLLTDVEGGDENDLRTWALNLLNGESPLPAGNIFGQVRLPNLDPDVQGLVGAVNGDDPPEGSVLPFTLPVTLGAGGSGGPWRLFGNLRSFLNVDLSQPGFDLSSVLSNFTNTRLGGIMNLFGGASNTTQAGNFMNNIKALFGNPTGMLAASFDPGTSGAKLPTGVGVPGGNIFGAGSVDFNAVLGLPSTMINLQALQDAVPNIVNGTPSGSGQSPTDFAAGVQSLVDLIRGGADGTGLANGSGSDIFTAIAGLRQAVVANSAAIETLSVGAGGAVEEFNTSGSGWGSDWDTIRTVGSGTISRDGQNGCFDAASTGTAEWVCRWIGAAAPTSTDDYQDVRLVLGAAPGSFLGVNGYNDVLLRMSSNKANYIRLRIRADGAWTLARCVSGAVTSMTSGTGPAVGAAGSLRVLAGNKATTTPRDFRAILNGVDLFGGSGWYSESGTSSMLGASYRSWGCGGRLESHLFGPQIVPGKINRWLANTQ